MVISIDVFVDYRGGGVVYISVNEECWVAET